MHFYYIIYVRFDFAFILYDILHGIYFALTNNLKVIFPPISIHLLITTDNDANLLTRYIRVHNLYNSAVSNSGGYIVFNFVFCLAMTRFDSVFFRLTCSPRIARLGQYYYKKIIFPKVVFNILNPARDYIIHIIDGRTCFSRDIGRWSVVPRRPLTIGHRYCMSTVYRGRPMTFPINLYMIFYFFLFNGQITIGINR